MKKLRALFKELIYVLLISTSISSLKAQHVVITSENETLSSVLLKLRDFSSVKVTFNHEELEKYRCTLKMEFSTPEEAISYLLADYPFSYEIIEDVFVIYPDKKKKKKIENSIVSGTVKDAYTLEFLPFVTVKINNTYTTTDQFGAFKSICTPTDSILTEVSYLGYYKLDTVFKASDYFNIHLYPLQYHIQEVEIRKLKSDVDYSICTDEPGGIKINPIIARSLPGYGDNSLYTCLTLMPGVSAAGSFNNELIIRGLPAEQHNIQFDGMKVFSLNRYFKHIGTINPLLIKDIELYKNGGSAKYGDLVGSMVNFTGYNGGNNPVYTINLNNTTLNAVIVQPVNERSTFIFAARQTYFNLLNPYSSNERIEVNDFDSSDYTITYEIKPSYTFHDAYAKYSWTSRNNSNFSLSILYASDKYLIHEESTSVFDYYSFNGKAKNENLCSSLIWSGEILKKIRTNVVLAYSGLRETISKTDTIKFTDTSHYSGTYNSSFRNVFRELKLQTDNQFPLTRSQNLSFGTKIFQLESKPLILQDSLDNNKKASGYFFTAYLEDELTLFKKLRLIPGFRLSYLPSLGKVFPEPRLSSVFSPHKSLTLKLHAGLYSQISRKKLYIDDLGYVQSFWSFLHRDADEPLKCSVFSVGFALDKGIHNFNAEVFIKKVEGLSLPFYSESDISLVQGEFYSRGLDAMYMVNLQHFSSWISYTFIKTSIFTDYEKNNPDNDHEIKWAGIVELNQATLSADFIYYTGNQNDTWDNTFPYLRFDISAGYKFNLQNVQIETGISLLNLFNTMNLVDSHHVLYSYDNNYEINILQYDLPRTLTAFVKVRFNRKRLMDRDQLQ